MRLPLSIGRTACRGGNLPPLHSLSIVNFQLSITPPAPHSTIVSHLCPWKRGMKKAMRRSQSANMAIQMPTTPKPRTRPSKMPKPTRMVHMDTEETTMVNRVSPAARRAVPKMALAARGAWGGRG